MPRGCTDSEMATAQRTARAGPSKVARNPSQRFFTSLPRKRVSCCRTASSYRSRRVRHCRSPISAARFVEPTMSVNITVARTRSRSGSLQEFLDFANHLVNDFALVNRPMISARKFDIFRTVDIGRKIAPLFDWDGTVISLVENERWDVDSRQHMPDF